MTQYNLFRSGRNMKNVFFFQLSRLSLSQGYDIEAVLGKHLPPMSCYVTEIAEHGTSYSFCLEEIQLH